LEGKTINTEPSAQEKPSVVTAGQKNKALTALLPLFTLFLGVVIGVAASRLMTPPQQVAKPQINPADLPISLRLLQNPAVYEWRGDVIGKLIAKDEHTLALEDEKTNKITITDLLPGGAGTFKTIYLKKAEKKGLRPTEVTLKDIPLGAMLKGSFFVFKNFPDTPVAASFTVE